MGVYGGSVVIRKKGDKWVVTTKSGRVLGTHGSKEKALKQLAAVEASKAAKIKSYVPRGGK